MPDVVGVVFAAGLGTRLRPLTDLLPKALCPVMNRPLVDCAIDRVRTFVGDVAVNVHHHRDLLVSHLRARNVHLSVEYDEPLGTAGGLAYLRDWVDGRAVLTTNADAWLDVPPPSIVDTWDGESVRLLVVRDEAHADFEGRWRFAGMSLMPWRDLRDLSPRMSGLYDEVWRRALAEGRAEFIAIRGDFFDCGTPSEYLAANMAASGGQSVIGEGAVVEGSVTRSVVWPGAHVRRDEVLVDCIRAGTDVTVCAPRE